MQTYGIYVLITRLGECEWKEKGFKGGFFWTRQLYFWRDLQKDFAVVLFPAIGEITRDVNALITALKDEN